VAFAALLLLAFCSLGFVTNLLHRAIVITPAAATARPDVIVICGGGGVMAEEQDGNSLGEETALRTLSGVAWWKQHRNLLLVMAGADETTHGRDPFTLRLMRQLAIDRGVPPGAILLDAWSVNTRQHPIGLARLGFGPRTRVGVVTSDWHLRRAVREFRRHFDVVLAHPASRREIAQPQIDALIPSAGALAMNTIIFDEYIGMLWYSLSAGPSRPPGAPERTR
jgi:uncharacterized SAM-binding protein YcdF (DUF218 family)